jgi:methyltransferase (TIGR00027 family)
VTAQRVAAQRLRFERVPASYGDPELDDLLARDVAGATPSTPGLMTRYLQARTVFFDRVVTGAVDAGVTQVVVAAAGYDGRALRYAKPGVAWYELDHLDTQRDKLARLARLGIATDHIAFVAADFVTDAVADRLRSAGHDASRPSLFTVEGVAVYLERATLERLLRELAGAAGPGSRLAISLSVSSGSLAGRARRAGFRSAVAAIGEPARTTLTADEADDLLAITGWSIAPRTTDRARGAGLVVASRKVGKGG